MKTRIVTSNLYTRKLYGSLTANVTIWREGPILNSKYSLHWRNMAVACERRTTVVSQRTDERTLCMYIVGTGKQPTPITLGRNDTLLLTTYVTVLTLLSVCLCDLSNDSVCEDNCFWNILTSVKLTHLFSVNQRTFPFQFWFWSLTSWK